MKALYNFYPQNPSDSLVTITGSTAIPGDSLLNLKNYKPSVLYRSLIQDDTITHVEGWEDIGASGYGIIQKFCHVGSGVVFAITLDTVIKILKSDDYGETWALNYTSTLTSARSIIALDANTILIGGNGGKVLKTTDAGDNWSVVNTGYTYTIRSLCDMGSGVVVAGCDGNYILRSDDSGATWDDDYQTAPMTVNFYSIVKTDTNIAFAFSTVGYVFKTTNNGIAWTRISTGSAISLSTETNIVTAIFTGTVIIAGGNYGKIYYSTNLGVTWKRVYAISSYNIKEITLIDGDELFLIANRAYDDRYGTVLKSIDAGLTWFSIGNISGTTSVGFTSINSISSTIALVSASNTNIIYSYNEDYSTPNPTIVQYQLDASIRSYNCVFLNRINFKEFYIETSTNGSDWTEQAHIENLTVDEVYAFDPSNQIEADKYAHYFVDLGSSLTDEYIRIRIPNHVPIFGVAAFEIGNFLIGDCVDIEDPKRGFQINYIAKVDETTLQSGFTSEYKLGRTRRNFSGSFDKISDTEYNKIQMTPSPFVLYLKFTGDPTKCYLVKSNRNHGRTFEEISQNASLPISLDEIV